jgi:hypothetical protein
MDEHQNAELIRPAGLVNAKLFQERTAERDFYIRLHDALVRAIERHQDMKHDLWADEVDAELWAALKRVRNMTGDITAHEEPERP